MALKSLSGVEKQTEDQANAQQVTRTRGATYKQCSSGEAGRSRAVGVPLPCQRAALGRWARCILGRLLQRMSNRRGFCGRPKCFGSLPVSVICPGGRGCLLWHGTSRRSLRVVDSEVHVVTFTEVCSSAAEV